MAAPKLRFKEFDQKWGVDALQDQIDFLAGYAFDSKLMSNEPQKYQLIKMSNVYQNQLDLTRNPSYWTKIDSKIEKFLLKKGDIVLTLTGTVGKTDYGYNVEIDKDDKFLLNQRLVRLRAKQDLSDSKFIQYRISTDKFFYHFFYSSKGGTGNQSNVSIEDLKLLELSFPSKEEQTKIASFLSAVDEKISQLTQKHQLLSQYKQGMMQKLFSQQLRFKADDGSEFGEWEERKLGEVCRFVNGRAYKQTEWEKEGTPVIRLQNLTGSGKEYYYSNLNLPDHQYCYNNDLLYMWSATFGPVFWQGEKAIFHYHIWKIEVNPQLLDKKYMYFLLDEMTEKMKRSLNGSTMLHVTKQGMENTEKIIPSLPEQTKIANLLSAIEQKIEVVAQKIEQAKQWKKGLLQQMFV